MNLLGLVLLLTTSAYLPLAMSPVPVASALTIGRSGISRGAGLSGTKANKVLGTVTSTTTPAGEEDLYDEEEGT